MILDRTEASSPLWQKIKVHYAQRLATLRTRNDKPLDDGETATLRGQIAEVKALLALDREPDMPSEPIAY